MKILLACQQSPVAYPIPAYGFWRTYFVEGLREAGHEVVEVPGVDWARGLLPLPAAELATWRDQTWSRVLATARSTPGLDLFLGYLYPRQIEPAALRSLRATGLPAVNFFCDNVREYRRLPAQFAGFDLHWVPEHAALPLYAARGWRAVFAPMPCWVPPARRNVPTQDDGRLCFIGRADDLRRTLLRDVATAGLPLVLAGADWNPSRGAPDTTSSRPPLGARVAGLLDFARRQGLRRTWRRLSRADRAPSATPFDFSGWLAGTPDDDTYAAMLSGSAVTLGVNRFAAAEGPTQSPPAYSRLRDIEAPMLGACYLTEWAPELPHLYDIGREIVTYRDSAELVEEARRLLTDPARRNLLRAAGSRRALADHTVGRSIDRLAAALRLPR